VCGIAGLINLNGDSVSPILLKRMTDEIAHRGPDGEGQWIEGNVGLGHRRLAIIDPSPAGHQPMISRDGRWVLTYNGEIYNFRELRIELEAVGYQFRSNTDSEVVLNAIAHWGADAIPKFNGMFAFAVWDRLNKRILLARDRYGIKPLYYSSHGRVFYFGSETKAIVTHPDFARSLNKPALLEYLTFQNLFTDQTLLANVTLLPAGHWLVMDPGQPDRISRHQYWDFDFNEADDTASDAEYLEELDRLFRQAVNRQLVSDVEIGAYLSGGLDSGLITAVASHSLPHMKSFTCGFDLSSASGIELGFDERHEAEMLSARFKTEMYEMVLKAGDLERCLPRVVWHLEEPRVGQSYPNYYSAQLASKFVKVVLSGAGGDELFGGYPWRYPALAASQDFETFISDYYRYWQRLISNSDLLSLVEPMTPEIQGVWTRDIFREVFCNPPQEIRTSQECINWSLYFESKTFLHGLLVVEDKLSMAHGLETRLPMLDNDLVDFAMRLPVRLKVRLGARADRIDENMSGNKPQEFFRRNNDGKLILRELAMKYLPEEIAKGRKRGFSAPDSSWFRGESIQFVHDRLLKETSPLNRILSTVQLRRLVNEHTSGDRNRRLLIWSLLYLDRQLEELDVL
jgi:asparagine synthase (glutamine-hydrolysing)